MEYVVEFFGIPKKIYCIVEVFEFDYAYRQLARYINENKHIENLKILEYKCDMYDEDNNYLLFHEIKN